MTLRTWLSRVVAATPLCYLQVRVRKGPAKGARWTLLPFSFNWRQGGEGDLACGLARLDRVRGAVCWDFGAHFGIHTVGMALQVGPEGQVVSFEPDPVAFERLSFHVRLNRLKNVVLFKAAVSNSNGRVGMIAVHGQGSTLSHLRYPGEAEPQANDEFFVESIAPDTLVESGQIRRPDLIKVDVQGHGASAIAGSIQSIRASRPVIAFSGHGPAELEGARSLLEPLNYAVESLDGVAMSWNGPNSESVLLMPRRDPSRDEASPSRPLAGS